MKRLSSPQHMADFQIVLSQKMIDIFFEAVGWSLPNRPPIPPTMATCFRDGEMIALKKLGVSLENILHGEQSYKYFKDVTPAGTYRGQTFLVQSHERTSEGHKAIYLTLQTDILNHEGIKFIECLTTVIAKKMAKTGHDQEGPLGLP